MKLLNKVFTVLLALTMVVSAGPGERPVAWDANDPSENVTTYKLYYGRESGVYTDSFLVNSAPQDLDGVLTLFYTMQLTGGRYYTAVTAINVDGESGYSNELTFNLPNPPQNHRKVAPGQVPPAP